VTAKPKKKRRLRKLLLFAAVVAAVFGYRERRLSANGSGPTGN
jgi:hypothetical protein